jgi:hypothetical protein
MIMKNIAGLWIDHRKAVIVVITDKGEEIKLVVSKVEKQLRRGGDSPLKGHHDPLTVPADDYRDSKFNEDLGIYYEAVIAPIKNSASILIFGPGEAKGQLKKRLIKDKLGDRIVAVETVDKMTDHQIAAKVRMHFFHKNAFIRAVS